MNIDLTPFFQAIIALLAALVTYKLIPWIRSKTTKQQQDNLLAAAKIAVFAAEQIYGAAKGDEKLDYALQAMEKAGFHLDKTLAREAIEKAVREMNIDPRNVFAGLASDEEDGEEEPEEEPETEEPQPFDVSAEPVEELAEGAPGVEEAPPDK